MTSLELFIQGLRFGGGDPKKGHFHEGLKDIYFYSERVDTYRKYAIDGSGCPGFFIMPGVVFSNQNRKVCHDIGYINPLKRGVQKADFLCRGFK